MKNANASFTQYTGSQTYYRHWQSFTYTEGVKALADECECYWLLDVIASHQTNPKVRKEPFQTWQLSRKEGDTFLVDATDGNYHVLVLQRIPYSDFRFDECTIWMVDGCMLLPTEY